MNDPQAYLQLQYKVLEISALAVVSNPSLFVKKRDSLITSIALSVLSSTATAVVYFYGFSSVVVISSMTATLFLLALLIKKIVERPPFTIVDIHSLLLKGEYGKAIESFEKLINQYGNKADSLIKKECPLQLTVAPKISEHLFISIFMDAVMKLNKKNLSNKELSTIKNRLKKAKVDKKKFQNACSSLDTLNQPHTSPLGYKIVKVSNASAFLFFLLSSQLNAGLSRNPQWKENAKKITSDAHLPFQKKLKLLSPFLNKENIGKKNVQLLKKLLQAKNAIEFGTTFQNYPPQMKLLEKAAFSH